MKRIWVLAILLGTILFLSGTTLAGTTQCVWCNQTNITWGRYMQSGGNRHYHLYTCNTPNCTLNQSGNAASVQEDCSFTIVSGCTTFCVCGKSLVPVHTEVID